MKFQTIVLTKRMLLYALASVVGAGAVSVMALAVKNKNTEVFGWQKGDYNKILKEGLSDYEDSVSLDIITQKILGFDLDNPETIIDEYSAAFEGTTSEEEYAAEDNIEPPAQTENTETLSEPQELPSHEQICASVGLKLNNATSYNVNIDALCGEELNIKPDSEEPQILVIHTHTTECYNGDEMSGETERTTDENLNVIAVGNEICNILEEYGIKTVHDTTYHDYPSYQGSYTRAMSTIDARLKEYPSVKAVLDIHRDAFVYSDGSRLRVACDQNGIETAQVMLVVGTNSMGLWHDNWQENLKFAVKIQNAAEIMYPGLMRPVNLRTERFNEHMTLGSLIIEVGSNGNSLAEAKEGGRDVARAIAAALING